MGKIVLQPGQGFGDWTLIKKDPVKNKYCKWICSCKCGFTLAVAQSDLIAERSRMCRNCKDAASVVKLVGKRFGTLVVLSQASSRGKWGEVKWLCKCDCGVTKEFIGAQFSRERKPTRNCGASHHRRNFTGRIKVKGGYISVLAPKNHPFLRKNGRMMEHRLVMEKVVGRYLKPAETVHHLNGIRDDNRPENLELWDGAHKSGQRVSDNIAVAIKYLEENGYTVTPPKRKPRKTSLKQLEFELK